MDIPGVIDIADIDTSHLVILNISNPHCGISKAEGNFIELGYNYPEERVHMIGIIKMAVRCELEFYATGNSKEGIAWAHEYYEYYKS